MAAATEENGGTCGKGILEKKSSFDKARKRCHKRIFGNEIIISRVLRYKNFIADNLQGSVRSVQMIDVACAVSENVYAVNEAFFAFDLFTILPSLQVIHCGKNTVQENKIYSDSNKCYRNTRESHCEPAACFKPLWNRVKCLLVQFGGSVLISKSPFADKSTVP